MQTTEEYNEHASAIGAPESRSAWEIERDARNVAIDAYLESLPIAYHAQFVPFSVSRNAGEKNLSVNWRVHIGRAQVSALSLPFAAGTLTADYMQGIAHLPGWFSGCDRSVIGRGEVMRAINNGRTLTGKPNVRSTARAIPAPLLRDVMYSLVLDADALDCPTYEDWAGNYGYDADSRKGEATYRQCISTALALRALIGDAAITQLQNLFQDY